MRSLDAPGRVTPRYGLLYIASSISPSPVQHNTMSSHTSSSRHHRSRSRSRSPSRRHRSDSPRQSGHRHRHHRHRHDEHRRHRGSKKRAPTPPPLLPLTLPLNATPISTHDYRDLELIFTSYLDIQKNLAFDELDEREARGRFKSFVKH